MGIKEYYIKVVPVTYTDVKGTQLSSNQYCPHPGFHAAFVCWMTLVVQVQRHRALQARVRRLSRSVHHVCECVRVCMCSPFARVCVQAAPRACVCSCACTHTQTNTHLQQYVPPHLGQRYDMSPLRVTIKEIRPSFASFITQANIAHPAPSPSPYHLQHVPTHARHVTPAPASAPPPTHSLFLLQLCAIAGGVFVVSGQLEMQGPHPPPLTFIF